ncbi:Calycin-like protein [Microthyrium microscopicum]|uniref:Calycin-like protein n=1 Tax=Microthyrium microscopicum TaxID=703497 RepID=A0A6A6U6W3_9PEZI|nr:Calycin-like protein [Microthyrium microscopicum]
MYKFVVLLSSLLAVSALPSPSPSELVNQHNDLLISEDAVETIWDGTCVYPKPDGRFKPNEFLGKWYQQAGTETLYNFGCTCVKADYTKNANGTIGVKNNCKRYGQPTEVLGSASPVNPVYGEKGALRVTLDGVSEKTGACPGPNYIVQVYEKNYMIVQTAHFEALTILSREQHVPDPQVDQWLRYAKSLGSELSSVVRTRQTGCAA